MYCMIAGGVEQGGGAGAGEARGALPQHSPATSHLWKLTIKIIFSHNKCLLKHCCVFVFG